MAWIRRVRDTGWQTVQTATAGLAVPGPNDPIQSFRVRRVDERVIVDLSGLKLDTSKPGLAMLGHLPDWAAPLLPHQYFWVNDHPTSLHPSVCSTFNGKVIYWNHQVLEGQIAVNRPETLRGGFEFTTLKPFPYSLIIR